VIALVDGWSCSDIRHKVVPNGRVAPGSFYGAGMTPDLGRAYRSSRERITAVARVALVADDTVRERTVPATPDWSVHDLIAHLAGVVEDALAGNMAGVTTDPWTAAQVERGRVKTTERLLDEWTTGSPMMEGFLSSPAGANSWLAVLDVHTHEADLLHALGRPAEIPADILAWLADRLLDGFLEAAAEAGLPPVTVVAPPFEIVRGRLGRRTADEVRAYEWSTDPAPYLDLFFVFGRRDRSLAEMPPAG
jgi:uncharacterized protein (TIGR03083 family)